MKISTIIKLIALSLAMVVVTFVILTISNINERDAVSTQAAFKQLGLDLSGASDFLTNKAREYVQFGEKKYFDEYMKEVEVIKTREHVVAELTRLGAPQNELELVQKAANLSNTLAQLETLAFEAVAQGDLDTARHLMFGEDYENGKVPIVSTMQEFQNAMNTRTSAAAESAKTRAEIMLVVFSVLFAAASAIIIFSLLSIQKKMIMVATLSGYASKIAEGNMDIVVDTSSHDEIGILAESFRKMLTAMQMQVETVKALAIGDLTANIHMRSKDDTMGIALTQTIDSLNNMFSEIHASSTQIAFGSKQIADGSQTLAQGSTEQSAAVKELSGSISEIAKKTRTNAEMAGRAANLADTIKVNAEKGSRQMNEMMSAVNEINEASHNIGKVIKVIDDIAFQTNILALNAAVEAARAGQHGKGFAVVAEEVRNLAAKSADAAKDTGNLITNSIEKAELGARIANETAASLTEIVSGIGESSLIISEIAKSSVEQSEGITSINRGITHVEQIVSQNLLTAGESASASAEMKGQSEMLGELISQFKLRDGDSLPNSGGYMLGSGGR